MLYIVSIIDSGTQVLCISEKTATDNSSWQDVFGISLDFNTASHTNMWSLLAIQFTAISYMLTVSSNILNGSYRNYLNTHKSAYQFLYNKPFMRKVLQRRLL